MVQLILEKYMILRYQKYSLFDIRKPTEDEDTLIRFLIAKANIDYRMNVILGSYSVQAMKDGRMGSLHIIPDCLQNKSDRDVGPMISEIHATDLDNTEVVVSLFLDTDNIPYELDVWKVDFTPIVSISSIINTITQGNT